MESIILGLDDIDNVEVQDLETEDVNLIHLGIDCSSSMTGFEQMMQEELEKFKQEIGSSSTVDQILIARSNFSDDLEIGGYHKVADLNTDYVLGQMTVLYDTIVNGSIEMLKYIDELKSQGMRVNGVFAIFSDGEDTKSKSSISEAKQSILELNKREIITAYMEFGNVAAGMGAKLGFKNVLKTGGSGDELRQMFGVLTTSVIQHSQLSVPSQDDDFFV